MWLASQCQLLEADPLFASPGPLAGQSECPHDGWLAFPRMRLERRRFVERGEREGSMGWDGGKVSGSKAEAILSTASPQKLHSNISAAALTRRESLSPAHIPQLEEFGSMFLQGR